MGRNSNAKDVGKAIGKRVAVCQKSGCWLWTGRINPDGYGVLDISNTAKMAHVLAYEFFFGIVPKGKELDHICRTRSCVNPLHLEPVTHKENMRRSPHYGQNGFCKNGHKMTKENTYVFFNKTKKIWCKYCRKCNRISSARRAQKKRGV